MELKAGGRKLILHRDTPRRFWVLLHGKEMNILKYSLLFLDTSLDFPLSIATAVYEQSPDQNIRVDLETNTKRYLLLIFKL